MIMMYDVCVCMCVIEKAFGYYRTEHSSFLLLCNLIGKIHTHTQTHTHTYVVSFQDTHTHALLHHTNMLKLCFLSL